jgi:uncharacterized protein (TIGR02246 family)
MTNEKNQTGDETKIRQSINRWVEGVRAKDVGKIVPLYAPDVLLFDLAPPLQHQGVNAYRKGLEEWFPNFEGSIVVQVNDLKINLGGDVAFTHSLNRLTGDKKSGEKVDIWVRVTLGFRKINGEWLVTHEHASVPFYMDGSFRAAVDLRP